MSTDLVPQRDPANCEHRWFLLLAITGRRVSLRCVHCQTSDMDEWGPGGIADLVDLEFDSYGTVPPDSMEDAPVTRIKVHGGQHNAGHGSIIPVDLTVSQSTKIIGYRSGGQIGMDHATRVTVTPQASPWVTRSPLTTPLPSGTVTVRGVGDL